MESWYNNRFKIINPIGLSHVITVINESEIYDDAANMLNESLNQSRITTEIRGSAKAIFRLITGQLCHPEFREIDSKNLMIASKSLLEEAFGASFPIHPITAGYGTKDYNNTLGRNYDRVQTFLQTWTDENDVDAPKKTKDRMMAIYQGTLRKERSPVPSREASPAFRERDHKMQAPGPKARHDHTRAYSEPLPYKHSSGFQGSTHRLHQGHNPEMEHDERNHSEWHDNEIYERGLRAVQEEEDSLERVRIAEREERAMKKKKAEEAAAADAAAAAAKMMAEAIAAEQDTVAVEPPTSPDGTKEFSFTRKLVCLVIWIVASLLCIVVYLVLHVFPYTVHGICEYLSIIFLNMNDEVARNAKLDTFHAESNSLYKRQAKFYKFYIELLEFINNTA